MELSEDSKEYLTVNTHKGLFHFQRLSFGVTTAPLIFQRFMDQVLQGIDSVVCSQDDILIETGDDESQHLILLSQVLDRLKKYNIKANRSKSEFFKRKLRFLGHIIDAQGLLACEDKVDAMRNIPAPTNVGELQSLIGMINFYGKFLPFQANTMAPLYNLLNKNVSWNWTEQCQQALDTVKRQLSNEPVLTHYDATKPLSRM